MDFEIGIVSEGVTDQITLEAILIGYFGNKNLPITRLQPKEDEPGNWDKVFKYCQSKDFKGAFAFLNYVIIHLDTDFMLRGEVPAEYYLDIQDLSVEEIIQSFRGKLIELIGEDFFQTYQNQILFAISVHEIECWFLPIYFPNQKKKAAKFQNCLDTLNIVLPQQEGFFIREKRAEYYEVMCKNFRKKKQIQKYAALNESFHAFIGELETKCISET